MKNNKKTVLTAVAGAVVGAGAAIAAGVALSDKKNQKKVSEVMKNTRDMVDDYSKKLQNRAEKGKVKLTKVVKLAKREVGSI